MKSADLILNHVIALKALCFLGLARAPDPIKVLAVRAMPYSTSGIVIRIGHREV